MNIFDFDGTLYEGDSSFDFWKFCLKRYPLTRRAVPREVLAALRYGAKAISLEGFKCKFYSYFRYVSNIDEAVLLFWLESIDRLRSDVLSFCNSGDVVASASPQFLLQPICDAFGLDLVASNVDKQTGSLLGPNCKGEEKVRRIEQGNLPLHYDMAFTDSLSDTPIVRLADRGILVTRKGMRSFPMDR